MANLTVTASTVHVVESYEQATLPAAAAITAGQVIIIDSNGKWALGNATTAANAGNGRRAIAAKSVAAGQSLTGVYRGLLDTRGALDALAFAASVFLSDTAGTLADTAGTVSTIVGQVVAGWGSGATADKLLRFNG